MTADLLTYPTTGIEAGKEPARVWLNRYLVVVAHDTLHGWWDVGEQTSPFRHPSKLAAERYAAEALARHYVGASYLRYLGPIPEPA